MFKSFDASADTKFDDIHFSKWTLKEERKVSAIFAKLSLKKDKIEAIDVRQRKKLIKCSVKSCAML